LVFYILKRYVFGRVVDLLEKRRETIEQGVKLTTELTAEREKLDAQLVESRKKARQEADRILAETHERAGAMLKEAEESAHRKIDNMMLDARKRITEETERSRRALQGEIVDLVVKATEAVASEKIDAKKDSDLIARALKGQA
jgi:F-type H+-transporting ATPase subunit b